LSDIVQESIRSSDIRGTSRTRDVRPDCSIRANTQCKRRPPPPRRAFQKDRRRSERRTIPRHASAATTVRSGQPKKSCPTFGLRRIHEEREHSRPSSRALVDLRQTQPEDARTAEAPTSGFNSAIHALERAFGAAPVRWQTRHVKGTMRHARAWQRCTRATTYRVPSRRRRGTSAPAFETAAPSTEWTLPPRRLKMGASTPVERSIMRQAS